jgi:mannan endo-1,4-beta-mannosidase
MAAELLADNPFDCLTLGCDFLRNHSPLHVDFCTVHLWPDTWLPCGGGDEAALRFARRWINAHVDCCAARLGKPLVVSEFGKKPAGPARSAFYHKVCARVLSWQRDWVEPFPCGLHQ